MTPTCRCGTPDIGTLRALEKARAVPTSSETSSCARPPARARTSGGYGPQGEQVQGTVTSAPSGRLECVGLQEGSDVFVPVTEGRVGEEEGLQAQLGAWLSDLRPGAEGCLGTSAGVTTDGRFVAVARFESPEAAKASSDRPAQGAWWEKAAATFDGDVTFTDCPDVDTFGAGGSDDAGFVQIMIGGADRAAIAPLAEELDAVLRRMRPDVIGGIAAWPGDGTFIQTVYFTSEGEARAKERAAPVSDEDRADAEGLMSLMDVDRYIDLPSPMVYSR